MEFKEAMRIWKRMCTGFTTCEKCPLYLFDKDVHCKCTMCYCPDEAEAILAKWAEEHPEKTIADDFFEKHPRAKRSDDGTPAPCAEDCGYIDKCRPGEMSCADCWRRPLEEAER